MSDQKNSSVGRWHESMDLDRFRKAEAVRRKRLLIAWCVVLGVSAAIVGFGMLGGKKPKEAAKDASSPGQMERPQASVKVPTEPMDIKKLLTNATNPVIKITTPKGDMLLELYEDKVPNTVANMISLAESGFYKGLSFHRIIQGFMAQGGCPNSKLGAVGMPGTGDPGYQIADEFDPSLRHDSRGVLSMANSGPNTNGSQFFICFSPQPGLDGKHTVFGHVIAGTALLDELEKIGSSDGSGTPRQTVRFDIQVVLKQDHPYKVKKL